MLAICALAIAGCGTSRAVSLGAAINGNGPLTPAQLKAAHVEGAYPLDARLFEHRFCTSVAICACALKHLDATSNDRVLIRLLYAADQKAVAQRIGAAVGECFTH